MWKGNKARRSVNWKVKLCDDGYWRLYCWKKHYWHDRKRETKEDCEWFLENILSEIEEKHQLLWEEE